MKVFTVYIVLCVTHAINPDPPHDNAILYYIIAGSQ